MVTARSNFEKTTKMPAIGGGSKGLDVKESWLSWRRSLYGAVRSSGGWTLLLVGVVCGATIGPVRKVAVLVGEFSTEVSHIAGGTVHAVLEPKSENKLSVRLLETDPTWLGLIFVVPVVCYLIWRKV